MKAIVLREPSRVQHLLAKFDDTPWQLECLPTIEIKALTPPASIDFSAHDVCIFTSVNAVKFVPPAWFAPLSRQTVLAIGEATQGHLYQHGVTATRPTSANSEGVIDAVLEHPGWQRILLVTGRGGRGLIEAALSQRGREVTVCHTYQRVCPPICNWQCLTPSPEYMIVPSVTALDNLKKLTPERVWLSLFTVQLIVYSSRIARAAAAYGFLNVTIVSPGDDDAVMRVIKPQQ